MPKRNTTRPDELAYSTDKDNAQNNAVDILPAYETTDIYDEQMINVLYQRRENHRNGMSKSYSAEDAIKLAKVK